MSLSNSISGAINAYLDRSNTQYAIMIDGSWGVGKTHFVLNMLIPERAKTDFVYASLYGLSTFDEIDLEINPQLQALAATEDGKPTAVEGEARPVVLCLDDLERWHGDLNLCLSYVNRLVEHKNLKCILIGNVDEMQPDAVSAFSNAREKTIRHSYHFDNDYQKLVEISLGLVEYGSQASRKFLRSLVKENFSSLEGFLDDVSVKNIRIITEAFQLYEYIYRYNSGKFKLSRSLAFIYLKSLISIIILLTRYLVDKKDREGLLKRNHASTKGFKFLSEIGYFEEQQTGVINPRSRLLLDTIFYRMDQISLNGLFSIVSNGYYIKEAFEGEFDCWIDEQSYDSYLDKDRYYQLDDDDAQQVFDVMLSSLMEHCSITNPVTLLLLAERITSDIACGVVDYNPVDFKKQFIETVDALYDAGQMQNMEIHIFDIDGNRFSNLRGIYNHILERNSQYQEVAQEAKINGFWSELKESPASIDTLLAEFRPLSVFSQMVQAEDIVSTLETLSNTCLYQVISWLEIGLDEPSETSENQVDPDTVYAVNLAIRAKYADQTGMRANHLRQIAEIILASNRTEEVIPEQDPEDPAAEK